MNGKLEMTWFIGNQLADAYEDVVITPDTLGYSSDSDTEDVLFLMYTLPPPVKGHTSSKYIFSLLGSATINDKVKSIIFIST
ncbi:unnamed protein product [Arctia plantaginis]|uniref:Uncharacterized protein n=1 Tax=Arctia plantaginis TaxID=874455 RepID=A0A8S1BEL4_ARCPL|nr:unnamed protein product [Arctia plantaginis]